MSTSTHKSTTRLTSEMIKGIAERLSHASEGHVQSSRGSEAYHDWLTSIAADERALLIHTELLARDVAQRDRLIVEYVHTKLALQSACDELSDKLDVQQRTLNRLRRERDDVQLALDEAAERLAAVRPLVELIAHIREGSVYSPATPYDAQVSLRDVLVARRLLAQWDDDASGDTDDETRATAESERAHESDTQARS